MNTRFFRLRCAGAAALLESAADTAGAGVLLVPLVVLVLLEGSFPAEPLLAVAAGALLAQPENRHALIARASMADSSFFIGSSSCFVMVFTDFDLFQRPPESGAFFPSLPEISLQWRKVIFPSSMRSIMARDSTRTPSARSAAPPP